MAKLNSCQKGVLEDICMYRKWRFKEDSHAEIECYCSREPRHYGYEPLCEFQCMEVKNNA